MLKRFEKRADERERRTYVEGVMMPEVDENAAVPRIGITFLPGADKPQVTRLEQIGMAGQEPDQMEAIWRVQTAASLLMQFTVSSDLSIVQTYQGDQTRLLVDRVRKRLSKNNRREGRVELGLPSTTADGSERSLMSLSSMTLSSGGRQDRVTIDSQWGKIFDFSKVFLKIFSSEPFVHVLFSVSVYIILTQTSSPNLQRP